MERFLFFTDPHLFEKQDHIVLDEQMAVLKQYVEKAKIPFVVCGGDWLGNSDSQEVAFEKLKYIDQCTRKLSVHYYPVLGNHDTNYQGVDKNGNKNCGQLTKDALIDAWFKAYGNTYYAFDGVCTRFYVLDCGIDWDYDLITQERLNQLHWLADSLLKEDSQKSAVIMHIYFIDENDLSLSKFSKEIERCLFAYNSRIPFQLDGKKYDFSLCTGKIGFVLSGHIHKDVIGFMKGDIPIIATVNAFEKGKLSFDVLEIDYNKGTINLIRIGEGVNREVCMPMEEF